MKKQYSWYSTYEILLSPSLSARSNAACAMSSSSKSSGATLPVIFASPVSVLFIDNVISSTVSSPLSSKS